MLPVAALFRSWPPGADTFTTVRGHVASGGSDVQPAGECRRTRCTALPERVRGTRRWPGACRGPALGRGEQLAGGVAGRRAGRSRETVGSWSNQMRSGSSAAGGVTHLDEASCARGCRSSRTGRSGSKTGEPAEEFDRPVPGGRPGGLHHPTVGRRAGRGRAGRRRAASASRTRSPAELDPLPARPAWRSGAPGTPRRAPGSKSWVTIARSAVSESTWTTLDPQPVG